MLIRTDGAGGTHEFVTWLTGQRLQYSVGFSLTDTAVAKLELPAVGVDPGVRRRPGVQGRCLGHRTDRAAGYTGWPEGMRVIVRAERPHPGAQLRFTDVTATGSPRSRRTPKVGNSRTWNFATAGAPAARTASARPRTLG